MYSSSWLACSLWASVGSRSTRHKHPTLPYPTTKNALWKSAAINSWYSHGAAYDEDALDLDDPDCTSTSGCDTVYFRYAGQNQYLAAYTLGSYFSPGNCTGRNVTVDYYANGVWNPMVRLTYVHMKSMRSSLSGSLGYAEEFNEWVGAVADSQVVQCDWDGTHLHYGRKTNYGTSASNGSVTSPLDSAATVFYGQGH